MQSARLLSLLAVIVLSTGACQLVLPLHEDVAEGNAMDGGRADGGGECASLRAYSVEVMADNPALYLRLGEATGPTAADETGHYPGTYPDGNVTYGAPGALAGESNTAVTFDGALGITMPPGLDFSGTAPFTLELWANQTAYAGQGFALDHEDWRPNQPRAGWDLLLDSTSVGIERWSEGAVGGSVVASDGGLALGTYHHVVVTFDGARLRLYIDAQARGMVATTTSMSSTTNLPWTIGAQNCVCSPNGFVGSLDEIAIYPEALTEARILAHYCAATRR